MTEHYKRYAVKSKTMSLNLTSVWAAIKSFFSKYSVALLIMVVLVLIYLLINKKGVSSIVQVADPVLLHTLDTTRDSNGRLLSTINQVIYDKLQVQAYADSLAKILKVKPKYIQGEDKVVIKDSIVYRNVPSEPVYVGKDTAYKVEVHDPWLDVVAVAGKDTGSILLKERDTLTRIEVVETPFIGKTKTTIFMGNSNPHDEILQGASFSVKQKEVFLTVGPDFQYNPFTQKVSLGISVQLPILKFKK